MKQQKIKPTPKPQANEFVASISNVCGYDNDHNCIRLKNGFAAMIQIPGIDILNYKRNNQEYVYGTFGQATQACPEPFKIIMLSDHTDYAEQIEYVPSLSDTEADEFMGLLEKTYERFGIDGNSRLELLKPTDFPLFSDVLSVLRGILYRDYKADSAAYRDGLTETRIRTLERLESAGRVFHPV